MKTKKQTNSLVSVKSFADTSEISRKIAEDYKNKDLVDFSSRDIYLHFRLKGTKNSIDICELDIRSNKEYKNNYHGVVGFELDSELLEQLSEDLGSYFIEMVNRICKTANVILYVPINTIESKKTYLVKNINNLRIVNISEIIEIKTNKNNLTAKK